MTIHVLHKQGKSIRAISDELGISRNTVRKYLRNGGAMPVYQRSPRPSKLDPYKAYLQKRIQAAAPDWIPATVLYREINELGYQGKISLLREYITQFKPVPNPDPVVRFETSPGEQLQVDFTIIRRQASQPLKAFVATLGYSRASYVFFFDNERSAAWLQGLQQAFDFFGGVPKEVLFDNAKAVVIERDAYGVGKHRWNPQLLLLAKEYGFTPKLCRPYRAKTKGKVERFNRYLKESFVVPLRAKLHESGLSLDVLTANGFIGYWLTQVANARIHATTNDVPNARLLKERLTLLPLPIKSDQTTIKRSQSEQPIPIESLQHPLSIYDSLLGV